MHRLKRVVSSSGSNASCQYIQGIIFLLLRYLQTSIRNAYDQGEPEEAAQGWLLAKVPFSKAPDSQTDEEKEAPSSVDETDDE